jgi:ribose transport system substrate-binding protein
MNHRIRRRVLAATVVLTAAAVLPFSTAYAQAAKKPKVALVMKSLANEFFLTMETGAKECQPVRPDHQRHQERDRYGRADPDRRTDDRIEG